MKRLALHLSKILCLVALNVSVAIAADPGKMPANLGDKPLATLSPPGDWKKNWTADNGNGTYSNPLFYEEFEDPDVTRVEDTYYLAGTTMHMNPAVQLMESKDLVNWKLAGYCTAKLDLGPAYRLEGGNIYGKGIWAPCIRYHDGIFYVFCNVNGAGLEVFRSKSIYGPWERNQLPGKHDMSVLFDDDLKKVFLIYGNSAPYTIDELAADLKSVAVPNAHKLAPQGGRMGEGHHLYKIKGTYYDISAIPGGAVNQVIAKAPTIDGPWTVTTMVDQESLGVPGTTPSRAGPNDRGLWLHQGGMVDTPSGEWWSIIMSDHGSAGRMVSLVPITWDNDFPLMGLTGNLRKAPNTWIKPNTGFKQDPAPANVRDDKFDNANLNPNWQWNHVEDDTKWSLSEKPGVLRLHSLPAANFYLARNTLCSRPPAPESIMTVELDTTGLLAGDTAGLGLLSTPYAWIGVAKTADGTSLQMFQGANGGGRGAGGRGGRGGAGAPPASAPATAASAPAIPAGSVMNPPVHLWLRVHCNFDTDQAIFSYSSDGKQFTDLGTPFTTTFQLTTFQGVRPGLFNYNTSGQPGGYADFDNYTVDEPRARGIEREIPAGKTIVLISGADGSYLARNDDGLTTSAADPSGAVPPNAKFQVIDIGLGRIMLKAANGEVLSVARPENVIFKDLGTAKPGDAESFQWVNLMRGDTMLMSLTNHQYLASKPNTSARVTANALGASPARKSGAEFKWKEVQ